MQAFISKVAGFIRGKAGEKFTGVLRIEINMSQGGVGKSHIEVREALI